MIASSLLEKTRFIRKNLQDGSEINFFRVIEVLKNVIHANIFVVNNDGKIFIHACLKEFECEVMKDVFLKKGEFPEYYHKYLLRVNDHQTRVNLPQKKNECIFTQAGSCFFSNLSTTLIPILGQGKKLGTLILVRPQPFDTGDLILAETAATVVGMEILKNKSAEVEEEVRHKINAKQAIGALSYSELEAAVRIFGKLEGEEGLLVTSKIADQLGITRSVTVNALRKLKSAGVIESHSLGMKGTYLKIINPNLLEQLEKEWI